ncbi:MAG: hypothetical protein ACMUIE_01855 [Thermoplasmatota archaeon]
MAVEWNIDMPNLIAIASLILVVLIFISEQRQLKKQMMLQNFSDYTSRYQQILLNLPLSITDKDFDIDKLDKEEKEKVLKWMRVYFDLCAEEYLLHRKKLIDEEVWEDWLEGMIGTYNTPAFRNGWEIISQNKDIYEKFKPFAQKEIFNIEPKK